MTVSQFVHRRRTTALTLASLLHLTACSGTEGPGDPVNTAGAAGNMSAPGGSGGNTTQTAGNGGTTGVSGSAGTVASSGAAGAAGAAAGAGGAGGSAGTAGMGGAAGAGGTAGIGTMGVQVDPGTEGDGTFPQPEPYQAPPESLMAIDGAPAGTLSEMMLYTESTTYPGLTFRYWVYVPAQYEPGKPAALMVYFDGRHYVGEDDADYNSPQVYDNLIHSGDIPVTIVLFVDPGSNNPAGWDGSEGGLRSDQYDTPNADLSTFVIDDLVPATLLNQYDIVEDPEGWGVSGHSSGGIAALMIGWFRPDKFRKLHTHNASFSNTGGEFPAQIEDSAEVKPLRIYMLSGTNDLGGWYQANNNAAEVLDAKGYHYRYLQGTGAHFPPRQAEADYANSLRWMWRGYSLPWYP